MLGREPTDEEIEAESKDKEKSPDDVFLVGLYRRFFNKNLKNEIEKSGLTAPVLAQKVGTNAGYISQIINFKLNPNEDIRCRLAIVLNCPVENIFPEKYDELYSRISPLIRETEVAIKTIQLNTPEVLRLPDPEAEAEIYRQADVGHYRKELAKAFDQLLPRERAVLEYRFGFDDDRTHDLEQTGQKFQVTRERIRQIEAKAIEKIRQMRELNLR